MANDFTRRGFMKTAGSTAGFMVASGMTARSYAQNEKVRLAVVGTGGQGNIHIRGGIYDTPDLEIVAVCDIYEPHQAAGQQYSWFSNAGINFAKEIDPVTGPTRAQQRTLRAALQPNVYYDYREMLEKEEIDAVLIVTPLDTHYKITMDCLDAGKYVFCEKTMCYTIEEGRNVVKKCHDTGLFVQVGHQRRYNPEYNLAMSIARDTDLLGRVNHIDMQWHRNNNWRRFVDPDYAMNEQEREHILKWSKDFETHMNWRIYEDKSLGLCTELFPHQCDVSNWFMGKMPSRIYGSGGIDYWRDGRSVEDNIGIVMEYNIRPGDAAFKAISPRSEYQNPGAINRGYTVRVVYSSIMANAKEGASEKILGDDGALELTEIYGSWLTREPHKLAEMEVLAANRAAAASGEPVEAETEVDAESAEAVADMVTAGETLGYDEAIQGQRLVARGLELNAHAYQFRDFARKIKEGGKPRTNEMCGLSSTILSILAFEAIRENKVIDIDPALMQFDFPTPEWNEYGPLQA